jgi:hypothetical protein
MLMTMRVPADDAFWMRVVVLCIDSVHMVVDVLPLGHDWSLRRIVTACVSNDGRHKANRCHSSL